MSNLVLPNSYLVAPQSLQFSEVQKHGPFVAGELVPWKGITFKVSGIRANENHDFVLILAPVEVTSGQVKRMNGKKGPKGKRG